MHGEVAIVTGGSSGIGRASAVAFAEAGAFVVVADLDEQGGQETMEQLGGSGVFIPTDVASERDVERLFNETRTRGVVASVHNNAAVTMADSELHELSIEVWDRVIGTNLRGAWLVLRSSLAVMREQGRGAIVNTSSIAGSVPLRGRGPYGAAKAGLVMLTRVAAVESAGTGVRVNAVAPGPIETPMLSIPVGGKADGRCRTQWPVSMGRAGRPEEVAAVVVWLCSDQASYINGAIVAVDGGWAGAGLLESS